MEGAQRTDGASRVKSLAVGTLGAIIVVLIAIRLAGSVWAIPFAMLAVAFGVWLTLKEDAR